MTVRAMLANLCAALAVVMLATGPARADLPAFTEVVDGLEAVPVMGGEQGLMTLYIPDPEDPTSRPDQLLCRIPADLLEQDLLFATTITSGPYTGYQWSDALVRWSVRGPNVVLEAPNTTEVAQSTDSTVQEAVEDTYPPYLLAALPIVAMDGQDPVVDLSSMLTNNLAGADVPGRPRPDLCQYTSIKVFPDNLLIEVSQAFDQGGTFATAGVGYALRRLPELGSYTPRIADERIGYFNTVRQDWSTRHTERSHVVRYINRWNLQKQDPQLALSPPVEPIVFIIEDTVPVQWRRWVRAGIEEWNRAYEAIGFSDAVVVYQQTDSNEFADIDPADARYNFVRWIVSGRAFAMGPSRVDPRTGQILDADIIIDDAFLRSMHNSVDTFGPHAMATDAGPAMLEFFQERPEFLPIGMELNEDQHANADHHDAHAGCTSCAGCGHSDHGAATHNPLAGPGTQHTFACERALGLQRQLAFAHAFAIRTAGGFEIPEELIGGMVRELVMHEVGHTLGLRHNFKGSAWLSVNEIMDARAAGEPTTASVMDYNATLFLPGDRADQPLAFDSPTIGIYDRWAIEYGYRVAGPNDGSEEEMLAAITSRSAEPGHAYATDEDTNWALSPDPLVNRWDMSSDPVEWARTRITLVDELMQDLPNWALSEDDSNDRLRSVFGTLTWERSRCMAFVARQIGGQSFSRSRPGDPGASAPLTLVDPDVQREALAFLGETIFDDSFFDVETQLLNQLTSSRWWDENAYGTRIDYPVHQRTLRLQANTLVTLMAPETLQRVYDAQLKTDHENPFTAAELLTSTKAIIWDLSVKASGYTDAAPMLSSTRRNLQLQHLQYTLNYIEPSQNGDISPDLVSMQRQVLRDLSGEIEALLEAHGADLDFASRAHLNEAKDRIDRALNGVFISR